jgi:hypothetical protein
MVKRLCGILSSNWSNSVKCSSRSSKWNNSPLNLNSNKSARTDTETIGNCRMPNSPLAGLLTLSYMAKYTTTEFLFVSNKIMKARRYI